MPSKTKKHSKTQSKLSHSNQCASPWAPPSLMPPPDSAVSEEELLYSLEETSSKYPSLIGKSAFIGRVTDVDPESKGCKIWLSEPSVVASSLAPGSIVSVFIDELDAIAPACKDGGEELSQRMVATLLNLVGGISRTDGLLVIAATNRPDCIEPALRRPGRLDREIEIEFFDSLFLGTHSSLSRKHGIENVCIYLMKQALNEINCAVPLSVSSSPFKVEVIV